MQRSLQKTVTTLNLHSWSGNSGNTKCECVTGIEKLNHQNS